MSNDDDRIGEVPAIQPRHLSAEERLQINQLKELEREILVCLDRLAKQKGGNTRCLSIARTEIQTGVMWGLREIVGESGLLG